MGLFNNEVKIKKHEIREGDHIYVYRAMKTYSHHGIFVGENKVVHFTPKMTESSRTRASLFTFSGMSSISASCPTSGMSHISVSCPTSYPDCGFRQPNSGVVITCLDCFLKNGSPYHYKYGVGGFFFVTRRPGTCTTAKSDPPPIVIYRAMHLLQKGFGNYHVFQNNCEDFALYCKTGLLTVHGGGRSGQANDISSLAEALLALPLAFLVLPMRRYSSDIGVRTDVIKVAVDDVGVILGRFNSKKK